jgi:pilus assembly protein CpaB
MARIQQLALSGGNRGLLLLALAAGLVAAVIVFIVLNQSSNDSSSKSSGGLAPALVAARDISVGTAITSDMVKVENVPDNLVVRGVFTENQPVVGHVSRVAIAKGEQLTPAKIGVPVPDKGLSGVVPAGKRAVSLEVSQVTAVGGLLLPGDHVDVVVAYFVPNAPNLVGDDSLLRTQTVLQNVEVLSVAQEAQQASARPSQQDGQSGIDTAYTSGQLPENVKEQPNASTLTLALDPQQAQVLISYQQHAEKVWAVLRPYGDQTIQDVPPNDVVVSGTR